MAKTIGEQRRKVSQFTLAEEANALTAATREYGEEVGMSQVALMGVLQAWRRAGFTHDQALDALDAGLATR